jgi:phospholipid/cholesterol/gamma-HCH transport system substrate-binding protein
MEEMRRNLMVGVFVLVGLGAMAGLIVQFGRAPTWLSAKGTYALHVIFDQVTDVRPGNLVTVKGILIGRVTSVDLVDRARIDSGVDVLVAIEKGYLVPEGSRAQTTESMLGQGRPPIEILPGPSENPALASGASIRGSIRGALDSLLPPGTVHTLETAARQIGDAAEALTPVLNELDEMMKARSPADVDAGALQGNISSAVARLDSSIKNINDVLGDAEVKRDLRDTITNVHDISAQLKTTSGKFDKLVDDGRALMADGRQTAAKLDQSLTKLDGHVDDLAKATMGGLDKADRLLDQMNTLAQQVVSGEGNLGKLFMDGKLYEAMTLTAERLSLAVEEFRALIAEWREGKVRVAL